MNEKDLKHAFQQQFQFDNWKAIFSQLFRKVDWLTPPQYLFESVDNVTKGFQFASVTLDDGKKLGLFSVEVADNVNIVSNRVGLRGIAAKYIDQYIMHGALVLYHSPTKKDYRFSFMAKLSELEDEGNDIIKETQTKRFTYLLGANETCTTAAKRFEVLIRKNKSLTIKDFIEAFSVEKLSNDFFKDYRDKHYSGFIAYLTGENAYGKKINEPHPYLRSIFNNDHKTARDFVKKLLGRLVFMHFLQKKGWLGCPKDRRDWKDGDPAFLQNLFKNYADKDHFLTRCLNELFFNTLNNDRHATNSLFPLTDSRVPYLNGGLFDRDKSATETIDFPPQYFADLLDFFEQYNFTIDENDPEEQEVGIDPEMLGHIFENLLEDNKDKGAFYTPKEIVQYMCQESLVQYLKTHLDTEGGLDEVIEQFVRHRKVTAAFEDKEMAHKINNLLKNVKICDPAIGSGAFPIGLLQEIYKARLHIYPFLKTATVFSPAKVKKEIIQNSIYGVDKDGGAVDIARLRFWLALIVDENIPEPLPNLDYKIMQGDSLLESFEGIDLSDLLKDEEKPPLLSGKLSLFDTAVQTAIRFEKKDADRLYELIHVMFEPSLLKGKTKDSMRQDIDKIVLDNINKVLRRNKQLLYGDLLELRKEAKRQMETQKAVSTKVANRLILLEAQVTEYEQKQDRVYLALQQTERPFFLWHTYFKDVFDKDGFDIVIGNPPYVQLQKMANSEKMYGNVGFDTYSKSSDIYCLFYEKGVNLLRTGGVLAYITSNSWLQTKYGASLRKFLREKTDPSVLLNFEDKQIFQTATVEANILLTKRQPFSHTLRAVAVRNDLRNMPIAEYTDRKKVILNSLDDNGWNVADETTYRIKAVIEENSVLLKDFGNEFYRGITTGFNDAFIIDEVAKHQLLSKEPKVSSLIKKIIRGRNLKKYSLEYDNLYLLFVPWHFPLLKDKTIVGASEKAELAFEKDFPILFDHFKTFKHQLLERNKVETGIRYEWYALQRWAADYWQLFPEEKIVWGRISDKPNFALDTEGYHLFDTIFFMVGKDLKYLLSILNSKVGEWYFNQISTSTGMGTNQWLKYKVEQLPIKRIENATMRPFEVLADYLLYLYDSKKAAVSSAISNSDLAVFFEEVLNGCVFELYFEEHMKERAIDILAFVAGMTPSVSETSESEKRQIIYSSYQKLNAIDSPVRERIRLFAVRSPEILLPILKST